MDTVDLVDAACPRLGLANDQRSRLTYAHQHHRCPIAPKPAPIEPAHQRKYCLTAEFVNCQRFRAWQDGTAAGRALLVAAVERDGKPPNEADEAPRLHQEKHRGRRRLPKAAVDDAG